MPAKSIGKSLSDKRNKSAGTIEKNPQSSKNIAFRQTQGSYVSDQSDEEMMSENDDQVYAESDGDEEMIERPSADEHTSGVAEAQSHEHKRGLKAKPTNVEIMALNETSLLFKSNLFKLQIDELLSEASVASGSKAMRGLDAALKQIRDELASMDSINEMTVDSATNYVRKAAKAAIGKPIAIPFPDPAPAVGMPLKLAFEPPQVINIVGSYPLGMAANIRDGFNVDIVVQMPTKLFQDRDHLNFRYFYKRAFYVAVVFIGLQQSVLKELFNIELAYMRSDVRLPMILLQPKGDIKHLGKVGCVIRILPSIAHDAMPLKRLAPERNHVRPSYIASNGITADADDSAQLPATPQYNAAILSDALYLTHLKYLFETIDMCPEFPRAAALLRIWIRQRSVHGKALSTHYIVGTQRINGFVLTMLLAWLLRGTSLESSAAVNTKLSPTTTAYQLFKSTIEFLAIHDFEEDPVHFGAAVDIDSFAENFGAVFLDPTSTLNLLSGAQEWELTELRMAARQTALDINHHGENRFGRIFLSAELTDLTAKYDHVFRLDVDISNFLSPRFGDKFNLTRRMAEIEFGHPVVAAQNRLSSFLSSALERHTRLVAVHPCADDAFDNGTKLNRRCVFFIGIIADTEGSRRLVDLGPNPDSQPEEAARFRAYWGDRAELRRFRDASIRLATVWGINGMSFENRSLILPRMVAYLLRRHFSICAKPEILDADDLLVVDKARPKAAQSFGDVGEPGSGSLFTLSTRTIEFAQTIDICDMATNEATYERAINGFDELQREIKDLEDQLPLRVLALHPVSPGLRYSSLAPPKPLDIGQGKGDDAFIEPLHAVIEFAGSNKWPDDITALHKVKAALLLRLSECYTAAHPNSQVDICNRFFGYGAADGLITGISPTSIGAQDKDDLDYERDNFLDIRHPASGFTFRLSVLCDREGALLAKKAQELEAAGVSARTQAIKQAHRRWMRNNHWRARHHRLILDMCQRHHPAASLTIRLLKRWLSRHMLLGQTIGVPEELAEQIAAFVFTNVSSGLAVPVSGYAGFVRCLKFIAAWQWKEDLCAVDFSADTREDGDGSTGSRAGSKVLAKGIWISKGMPADAYATLQTEFDNAQKSNKIKNALRIVSEDDPTAQWWGTVSPVLTRRLRDLANASLKCIVDCIGTGNDEQLPQVFTTPLGDYDFIIKLDREILCRKYEQPPKKAYSTLDNGDMADSSADAEGGTSGNGKAPEIFKNLLPSMQTQLQPQHSQQQLHIKQHGNPFNQPGMVNFDPVAMLVRDLVDVYGDSILFFHDIYGGDIITGLWNPSIVKQAISFSAGLYANVKPVSEEKTTSPRPLVKYNTEDVISEIIRLGDGLIDDFIIQRK
ncbi:Nrap protein [Coemansia spiralis]|nr:Nrap protein [Coemansia spiralis]